MKKASLFFLVFVLLCSFFSCDKEKEKEKKSKLSSTCSVIDTAQSSNAFYPAIMRGGENFVIGGVINDSISCSSFSFRDSASTISYTQNRYPLLPKPLMNGFGFRLRDTIYYGGGYTTNWVNKYTAPLDTLSGIIYTSTSQGYTIGQSGRVFSTTNSGTTWNEKKLNTSQKLIALDFISGSGWVLSDSSSSKIFKTTNSGTTWDNGINIGNAQLKSIKFLNQNSGWAAGASGKIFKTTDGGAVWDSVQRKSFEDLNSIFFLNQTYGWACGDNGRVIKTTNGGTSWDTLKFNSDNLLAIAFQDSTTGYLSGAKGTLAKSTDRGNTWSSIKIESSKTLRSLSIKNKDTVIACGENGNLVYTTNGISWERVYGITPNNLNSVCFLPGSNKSAICGLRGFTSLANEGCFRYAISGTFYKRHWNNSLSAWDTAASFPIPISEVFCSGGALNDSIGYVVGGKTLSGIYSDKIYRYSSKSGRWTQCTKLPAARSYGGLAVVSDTMMLYLGGINSVNVTDTMYKISAKISSGEPDSLNITFGAKNPAGSIYAEGSTGIKKIRYGVFAGGMDSAKNIHINVLWTQYPYNTISTDTCPAQEKTYTPVFPSPGSYTINWVCPTAMDSILPVPEPNSTTFEYLILQTNIVDEGEGTINPPTTVSYDFVCCVCRNMDDKYIIGTSPNRLTMEVTDEVLNLCNDGSGEEPQSKKQIVVKNDSYLNGSFRILMMGGVNNKYNLNNNCSHYKLH